MGRFNTLLAAYSLNSGFNALTISGSIRDGSAGRIMSMPPVSAEF
jgi:hypothetical protein